MRSCGRTPPPAARDTGSRLSQHGTMTDQPWPKFVFARLMSPVTAQSWNRNPLLEWFYRHPESPEANGICRTGKSTAGTSIRRIRVSTRPEACDPPTSYGSRGGTAVVPRAPASYDGRRASCHKPTRAPVGSRITLSVPSPRKAWQSISISAPSALAFAVVAPTSATPTYGNQLDALPLVLAMPPTVVPATLMKA